MREWNFRRGLIALSVLMLAFAVVSAAQTFRGTIVGTVMDASGAAIAGAKVIVKNMDTGLTRQTETSDDGSFSVTWKGPGMYWLGASVQDDKTAIKGAKRRASYTTTLEVLPQ